MPQYDGTFRINTKIDTEGIKKGIKDVEKEGKKVGEKTNRQIESIAGGLKKLAAAAGLAKLGKEILDVGMSFESAFAGVKKTVNASAEELSIMRGELREMSKELPTSSAALSDIAASAGQLGIETANITKFTRVMADLGVATNLTGEEAATTFARFANITGMPQTEFERLGSTVVALGNNFATTESEIAAMALRLAGAGTQIGMSNADIMSVAAALSSVGIEAEAGGSSFSRLMSDIQLAVETGNSSLKDFAKVSGMSAADFSSAFKEDAAGAITSFIKGLASSEKQGKSATAVLDEMGITEIRLKDALLRAAGASGVFEEAIKLGNDAWQANTALSKEAEQRYETLESKWGMLKNAVSDLGITIYDSMRDPLADAADAALKCVDGIGEFMSSGAIEVITAMAAPLAAAGAGYMTVTTSLKLLTAAQAAFNAVQMANPVGLAVAGVAALATGLGVLYAKTTENTRAIKENANEAIRAAEKVSQAYADRAESAKKSYQSQTVEIDISKKLLEELDKIVDEKGKVKEGYEKRAEFIMGELSKATGQEITLADLAKGKYQELKKSIEDVIQAKKAEIWLNANQESYASALSEQGTYTDEIGDLQQKIQETKAQIKELENTTYSNPISLLFSYGGIEQLKEALSSYEAALDEYVQIEKTAAETVSQYEEMQKAAYEGNYEAVNNILNNRNKSIDTANKDAATAAISAADDIGKRLKGAAAVIESSAGLSDDARKRIVESYEDVNSEVKGSLSELDLAILKALQSHDYSLCTELVNTKEKLQNISKDTLASVVKSMLDGGMPIEDIKHEFETIGISLEPIFETYGANLGLNIDTGTAEGITNNTSKVTAAAEAMARASYDAAKQELDIRSPSHRFRDEVGKMIALGLAVGIDKNGSYAIDATEKLVRGVTEKGKTAAETQENLQKRMFESLKNSFDLGLITEEQYYNEAAKLRDRYFTEGSEDWEKWTLEILDFLQTEAKEQKDALVGIYEDMAQEIGEQFDKIEDAKADFADKLGENADGVATIRYQGFADYDIVDTVLKPSVLAASNEAKKAFADSALAAKQRLSEAFGSEYYQLTDEIFNKIRDLGIENGTAYANAINNASDTVFAEWIAEYIKSSKLDEAIAADMYADDFEATGARFADNLKTGFETELEKEFGTLPAGFWDFGEDAAKGFYDGFMADLNGYMSGIMSEIESRLAISVSGTDGGNNTYNNSYTYNIQPSSGESTRSQLEAVRNNDTYNRLRGGY